MISGTREIPLLSITILKEIAKNPGKYVTSNAIEKSKSIRCKDFDMPQVLIDYVIEAGRLTDDALPLDLFHNRVSLNLKNSKISPVYLEKIIRSLPDLTSLDISGTFLIDDASVAFVLRSCPQLKYLGLQNCRKLTNASLVNIAENGKFITSLRLGGNFNLTVDGLQSFVATKVFSELTELSLAGLPINDEIILKFAKKRLAVKKLSLAYANVTEATLRVLFDNIGPQLESLNIAWMGSNAPLIPEVQITSEFVSDYLPTVCTSLTELDASGLRNITAASLVGFLDEKVHQAEVSMVDSVQLRSLKAKFVGSSKAVLEQSILSSHAYVSLTT